MIFIQKHLKNTLNNNEITTLFDNGKWLSTENISMIYLKSNNFKYMVSAPIKNFKKAVHRNKIKRLMRNGVINYGEKKVNTAFIYRSKTILNSEQIKKEIKILLNRI